MIIKNSPGQNVKRDPFVFQEWIKYLRKKALLHHYVRAQKQTRKINACSKNKIF